MLGIVALVAGFAISLGGFFAFFFGREFRNAELRETEYKILADKKSDPFKKFKEDRKKTEDEEREERIENLNKSKINKLEREIENQKSELGHQKWLREVDKIGRELDNNLNKLELDHQKWLREHDNKWNEHDKTKLTNRVNDLENQRKTEFVINNFHKHEHKTQYNNYDFFAGNLLNKDSDKGEYTYFTNPAIDNDDLVYGDGFSVVEVGNVPNVNTSLAITNVPSSQ